MTAWQRRPNETARAHAALTHYLEMGPQRSLKRVGQESGVDDALIARWSGRHGWVKRAAAYDAMMTERAVQAQMKLVDRRVAAHQRLGEDMTTVAHRWVERLSKRLDRTKAKPLTAREVARLARDGVVIERMSLGLPVGGQPRTEATAVVDHQGRVGLRIIIDDDPDEPAEPTPSASP